MIRSNGADGDVPSSSRKRGTATTFKVLVAMFVVLLVSAAVAIASPDEPGGDGQRATSLSAPPVAKEAKELPDKRTAVSKTFALPNGSRELHIYQSPVNYRDEDGDWKPIDNGLRASATGLVNGENSFDLHLPQRMGDGAVRIDVGDQWLSYKLLGSTVSLAKVGGDTASYESQSGVSFELTSLPTGVKENIVLADAGAPSSFAFELGLSEGLIPSIAEDGSLAVRDGEGKLFAVLPAPVIADSSAGAVPNPRPFSMPSPRRRTAPGYSRLPPTMRGSRRLSAPGQ